MYSMLRFSTQCVGQALTRGGMQGAKSDVTSIWEPACPLCFEPFSTEAADEADEDDMRPVLRHCQRSVCASCYVTVRFPT